MRTRLFFSGWLCLLVGQLLVGSEQDFFMRQRMIGDLEFIKNTFHANYANIEWKKNYSGWDLEREIEAAKFKVLTSDHLTTKEFQTIVKKFCLSTKDYHVTAEFYSTECATLPFSVQSANHRYFFSQISKAQISPSHPFPFEVGDELIAFDGVPIQQVIDAIKTEEIGENQPLTDQAMAELNLTTRIGMFGHVVPSGKVVITGKRKKSSKAVRHEMEWNYLSEKVGNFVPKLSRSMKAHGIAKAVSAKKDSSVKPFFKKEFVLPQYAAIKKIRSAEEENEVLGGKKSFIPLLGHVLWEAPEDYFFNAYIFETSDGRPIGYIRIPTYSPDSLEKASEQFAEIMALFQDETEAMVIDQLNNPGGSVLYMYALISMLTDTPLTMPSHRQMITQEDVFFAFSELEGFEKVQTDAAALDLLGSSLEGMPVNAGLVKSLAEYLRFTIDEWTQGRIFTQPGYVYGIGPLMPHPHVRYTKPLLVLVNALDFSGADFFPAILQDNARATIMGTKTAGAGGYVAKASFPNLNGIINIAYTASIAQRADNRPIENEGVSPDIIYEFTEKDLQRNYGEYIKKIQQILKEMK